MAQSTSRSFSKILKFLLIVVLIAAASIGATLYYTTQTGSAVVAASDPETTTVPEATPSAPVSPPIFVALDPFTVTLRNERTSRILHVAITLRVNDEASSKMLDEYMPEVRDRVLSRLSEQHPIQVQTTEGRAKLVQELSNTLAAPYSPQPRGPNIQKVLFTAFVVQ